MNTFVIKSDILSADYASRFNLFALTWGGQEIVRRVLYKKMALKGYVPPQKEPADWTKEENEAFDVALRSANDGGAPPFDFIDCYEKLVTGLAINRVSKTFTVNGTATVYSFDGKICDLVLKDRSTIEVRDRDKTPGQLTNTLPQGAYLLAQIYYDRSADELYIVTFRRFFYQALFSVDLSFENTNDVNQIDLGIGAPSEVLPFAERLFAKRWALMSSADYGTSIEQTRGLTSNQWVVLEAATFLSVPVKPKVVKFYLSRFFTKFNYPFRLADFVIIADGCTVAESADGAMAVTVTGVGSLEVVPKSPTRIFLGEDVVRTSDLHLRLTVI